MVIGVVSVSFVLFQGSAKLVGLQRLANVKVDLMSKKVGYPWPSDCS